MIKHIACGAVLAAALCGTAFAQDDTKNGSMNTGTEPGTERGHATRLANPPAVGMLSEGAIVGFFQSVDQAETEAAQAALERSKNEEVLSFARQMIVDHGDASRKLNDVGIQPVNSDMNRKLKEHAKSNSRRLSRLEGPAFDRAYINGQVEDHAMVLDKIDTKVAPAAKSQTLVTHVQERRPVIESHLEHARRIKASIGAK